MLFFINRNSNITVNYSLIFFTLCQIPPCCYRCFHVHFHLHSCMETVKRTYEHSIAFAWLVLNVHVKIILNGRPLEILGVGGGGQCKNTLHA